jgi:ribosomal protein S18 acetylase RimI-like enzyme
MANLPYLRMRRRLGEVPEIPNWPRGLHAEAFAPSRAAEAHALLALAYADGGGSVPSFEMWWSSLSQDPEYDAGLCFPVSDAEGRLVGFAQCWTTGFVKDFAVHPQHRRRGIGRALLLHIFSVFRERGAQAVDLKVRTDNPSGAVPFYEKLGMVQVPD